MRSGSSDLLFAVALAFLFIWRCASGNWQLPCPSLLGWALESRFYSWLTGTKKTLDRMHLQPGQRILEMGPGPGRLLVPAAGRINRSKFALLDFRNGDLRSELFGQARNKAERHRQLTKATRLIRLLRAHGLV